MAIEEPGEEPGGRRRLAAVSDGLDRAITVACIACILAMLAISFIGFFYMVVTGAALSWTYSLARLFIPWIGLLSITVAFKRGEHVAMTSLLGVLPAPAVSVLRAVNLAVAGLFAVLLAYYGWTYFQNTRQLYMVSDQIQVHARWVAAAVPVTGAVLIVHMLCGRLMVEPAGPPDLQALAAQGEAKAAEPARTTHGSAAQ